MSLQAHIIVVALLYSTLLHPHGAAAQVAVTPILGGPTCGECVVERYRVAVIHDREFREGAMTDFTRAPLRLRDGRFVVITRVGVFLADERGAIRTEVGREGQGPGEFLLPMYALETPEAILLLSSSGRVNEFRKADLTAVDTRTMPSPSGTRPIWFSDGSMVISAHLQTRESAGLPLHLVSAAGEVVRSFGTGGSLDRPRHLAPSGDTAFWAARGERYRMELWHRDGRLLRVIDRKADWFRPPAREMEVGERHTSLSGLHEDAAGRLWVHVKERTRSAPGRIHTDHDASASMIEVLDPSRAVAVASLRVEHAFQGDGTGGFHTYTRVTDQVGNAEIHFWGYRLREPSSQD